MLKFGEIKRVLSFAAAYQIAIHSIGELTAVKQLKILCSLLLQIKFDIIGIEHGTEPQHTEIALNGRRRREPAVGTVRSFIIVSICNCLDIFPLRLLADCVKNAFG